MRRSRVLILFLNILCTLIISYFVYNYTFKPMTKYQTFALAKQWTLLSRNNRRLDLLYEKYNLLLNLTKFQPNSSLNKTIIYSCQSFCGGWGDRLRGILSVYILSLLTNRHFMIDMSYPCDISKVVQPNLVNWTYIKPTTINRTRLNINTMRSWQRSLANGISDTVKTKNFPEVWSSYDDIYITTNSDYMSLALRNPYMLNKTRDLLGKISVSQTIMQTLFALLFELLFKPSISVHQRVDSILSASYNRHLICLHIRIGKNPTNPLDYAFTSRRNITETMLDFTDKYLVNKSSSVVFITSDSGQAVSDILRHYPNSSMTIVGPILHIDRFDRRSSTVCDGFIKVLSDFYLLGECQSSFLTHSGFSAWANRRREKPFNELFVYNEKLNEMRRN